MNKDLEMPEEEVFRLLVKECEVAGSESRLSGGLTARLSELDSAHLEMIVGREHQGCAPLFLASKHGAAGVAEFLISK